MFDTHIHTKPFSTDSGMRIEEVQEISVQKGLGIVLTEHMDYDFPPPDVYEFNPETYFQNYGFCRNDQFLLGVEIGLQSIVLEKNKELVNSYPFDMVIGSVHAVYQKDLYYQEFREQIDMILEHLACQEKSLEINTRLFGKQEAVQELEKICRRFKELGGRTVTVGSDAHRAAAVGSRISEAYAMGIRCGLLPVIYRKRQAYEAAVLQI